MSYFFGSLFGRNNLKIEASPNKTWEGFIGGLFCSVLFSYVSFNFIQEIFPFWKTIVLGFIIPIFGLFGDIIQSKIKRKAGVKDSIGKLFQEKQAKQHEEAKMISGPGSCFITLTGLIIIYSFLGLALGGAK